jgi:hypothetical protein
VSDPPSRRLFGTAGPIGGFTSFAPLHGIRVGVFVADRISLEPSFGFNLSDFGDETLTRVGVSLTALVHTTTDFSGPRPFLGVGGNFMAFDFGDGSVNQFGAHGLIGASLPVVEKLAARLAVGGGRFFENDDVEARWTVFGTVGMSFRIGGPPGLAAR